MDLLVTRQTILTCQDSSLLSVAAASIWTVYPCMLPHIHYPISIPSHCPPSSLRSVAAMYNYYHSRFNDKI